jgi:hypothetical protein
MDLELGELRDVGIRRIRRGGSRQQKGALSDVGPTVRRNPRPGIRDTARISRPPMGRAIPPRAGQPPQYVSGVTQTQAPAHDGWPQGVPASLFVPRAGTSLTQARHVPPAAFPTRERVLDRGRRQGQPGRAAPVRGRRRVTAADASPARVAPVRLTRLEPHGYFLPPDFCEVPS